MEITAENSKQAASSLAMEVSDVLSVFAHLFTAKVQVSAYNDRIAAVEESIRSEIQAINGKQQVNCICLCAVVICALG